MDTRESLPKSPLFEKHQCVYCGGVADTNDHTPPRCFLKPPLPSNLITLPACRKCNSDFSYHENLVRTMLALISNQPDLAAERQPGGRADRALARDRRLGAAVEACRRPDGNFELNGEALDSFISVLTKTTQGLYFGLYEKFVPRERMQVLVICDRRHDTPESVVNDMRPAAIRDLTDEPISEISPSAWMVREPIFVMQMQPVSGGPQVQRLFRMVRETPVEWTPLQPGIFSFAFIQHSDGRAVCVLDIQQTLIAAVAAPWPHDRGPLRKGRKNPFSRER
jgi:hypothetical protein